MLLASAIFTAALAEEEPGSLSGAPSVTGVGTPNELTQFELESQLSQVRSELRAQRDIADMRTNAVESKIDLASSSLQRQLISFMLAVGIVVFVVLLTLNKHTNVNNERMRNLIREADRALDDLHRLIDRPDTEHFNVSRRLGRVMNKFRERSNPSLPQKDITDVYAAADDPTLPVSLHLQANALRCELQGKWSDSVILWKKLLNIDDTSPEVMLHLAQNYKRLAEVGEGETAARYSSISMDYFQKYAVRTNIHTHSERELRKMGMIGELASTPSNLAHHPTSSPPASMPVRESLADQATPAPQPPMPPKVQLAKPELKTKSIAGSLLDITPKKAEDKPQEVAEPEEKKKEAFEQARESEEKNAEKEKRPSSPEPQSSAVSPDKQRKSSPGPSSRAEKVKPKAAEPAVKASPARPPVINRSGVASNGAAKPKVSAASPSAGNGKKKELSAEQIEIAYKSRTSKARDYFKRYASAKRKSDKLQWLAAAAGEYEAAEKYKQEKEMYQLWGIAILETAGVDVDNYKTHAANAAKLFKRANEICDAGLFNELALCYAMVDNEIECRKVLEIASERKLLDADIYQSQPSFEKYKERPWYQELASS